MVFIYRVSGVFMKENGINKKRVSYYRTVYYKTLQGKENSRNLRCRKNGQILARSKIWQAANTVAGSAFDNNANLDHENKIKAAERIAAFKEERRQKHKNKSRREKRTVIEHQSDVDIAPSNASAPKKLEKFHSNAVSIPPAPDNRKFESFHTVDIAPTSNKAPPATPAPEKPKKKTKMVRVKKRVRRHKKETLPDPILIDDSDVDKKK